MKIYVLMRNSDDKVIGTYSSEEKAMEAAGEWGWTHHVEEHWLDEVPVDLWR